jgi:hypothetical protein
MSSARYGRGQSKGGDEHNLNANTSSHGAGKDPSSSSSGKLKQESQAMRHRLYNQLQKLQAELETSMRDVDELWSVYDTMQDVLEEYHGLSGEPGPRRAACDRKENLTKAFHQARSECRKALYTSKAPRTQSDGPPTSTRAPSKGWVCCACGWYKSANWFDPWPELGKGQSVPETWSMCRHCEHKFCQSCEREPDSAPNPHGRFPDKRLD